MPHAKSGKESQKEQSERFIQTARELDADESGEGFEKLLDKVVMPKTVKLLIFFVFMLLSITAVYADTTLPMYQVNQNCSDKYQGYRGGVAATASEQCVADEQESYDTLKNAWPGIPEQIKQNCLDYLRKMNYKLLMYVALESCIDPQLHNYELKHQAPFHY